MGPRCTQLHEFADQVKHVKISGIAVTSVDGRFGGYIYVEHLRVVNARTNLVQLTSLDTESHSEAVSGL